jgi:transcriptional antiterminator RfaH
MESATSYFTNSIVNQRLQPCWYAIYTRPHHEKTIYNTLIKENIHSYLPLQSTIKQWSDRKKKVSIPLISCYVFVKITSKNYYSVLNVPGVIRFVTFDGKAKSIPEKQIQLIKNILEYEVESNNLTGPIPAGTKVEIKAGPLTGVLGHLVEYAGKKRVIVFIEEINKSIMVNVPLCFLQINK